MKGRVTVFSLLLLCVIWVESSWGLQYTFVSSGTDGSTISSFAAAGFRGSFFGNLAGQSNAENDNSFFGASAGRNNTTGDANSFFGSQTGYTNSTGHSNSFFGTSAGYNNNTGSVNSFFGSQTGVANSTGSSNSFFGSQAGYTNSAGVSNSFFGASAGRTNMAGHYNSIFGAYAGYTNTGHYNSFFGTDAGYTNTTGGANTIYGYQAGYMNSTGSGNIFIGNGAGYSETLSNKLYIDNCYTGGSCTSPLIYGDFSAHYLTVNGTVTAASLVSASDARYKRIIQPLQLSLDKLVRLTGVSYEWKTEEYRGNGFKEGTQIGLIAQDVEKVFPELVQTDGKGYKAVAYDKLVPVLIEAVKEQQKEIKEQQKALASQKNEIADLNEKLSQALKMMEQRITALEDPAKTLALK